MLDRTVIESKGFEYLFTESGAYPFQTVYCNKNYIFRYLHPTNQYQIERVLNEEITYRSVHTVNRLTVFIGKIKTEQELDIILKCVIQPITIV